MTQRLAFYERFRWAYRILNSVSLLGLIFSCPYLTHNIIIVGLGGLVFLVCVVTGLSMLALWHLVLKQKYQNLLDKGYIPQNILDAVPPIDQTEEELEAIRAKQSAQKES